MLNIVSLLIGLIALVLVAIAILPIIAIANWIIVPIAVVGAGIGQLSSNKAGRNLNLFVIVVGVVRLIIGGGIL